MLLLNHLIISPSPSTALQGQKRPVLSTSHVSQHSSSRPGSARYGGRLRPGALASGAPACQTHVQTLQGFLHLSVLGGLSILPGHRTLKCCRVPGPSDIYFSVSFRV